MLCVKTLTFSTLWTNQSVSNMSYLIVHWMFHHGMLHLQMSPLKGISALDIPFIHTVNALWKQTYTSFTSFFRSFVSMGIVGVKSTAGREVKFIDPSKTTKSESTWLGYPLCDWLILKYYTHFTSCTFVITLQWRTKVGGSKRIRYPRRPINYIKRWALNCI